MATVKRQFSITTGTVAVTICRLSSPRCRRHCETRRAYGLPLKEAIADSPRFQTAKKMHADKSLSIGAVCDTLRIPRATFCRYLAAT